MVCEETAAIVEAAGAILVFGGVLADDEYVVIAWR